MNLRNELMVSKMNYINPCKTPSSTSIKTISYVKMTTIEDSLAKGPVKGN